GAVVADPDVSLWDVGSAENLADVFQGAASANPTVTKWDVRKVTSMHALFESASVAKPNVTAWQTDSVKTTERMFAHAVKANPCVSSWNVQKVATVRRMFYNATCATPNLAEGFWSDFLVDGLTPSLEVGSEDVATGAGQLHLCGAAEMTENFNDDKQNAAFGRGADLKCNDDDPFRVRIEVESAPLTVKLPLNLDDAHAFTIFWGDAQNLKLQDFVHPDRRQLTLANMSSPDLAVLEYTAFELYHVNAYCNVESQDLIALDDATN
ncbi:unnamed protein product, partial [Amoebophrya sp. A120]